MKTWQLIIILVLICVTGLMRLIYSRNENEKHKNYINNFLNEFREYSDELIKGNDNNEKYELLKIESVKAQMLLGNYGKAAVRLPYSDYINPNYSIIIDGINDIRNLHYEFGCDIDNSVDAMKRLIENPLLTFIGAINNFNEEIIKSIKNPIIWLREGVRFILSFPFILIYWLDIIPYSKYEKIYHNSVMRFISSIVTIIGLISSVITITGYNPFIK